MINELVRTMNVWVRCVVSRAKCAGWVWSVYGLWCECEWAWAWVFVGVGVCVGGGFVWVCGRVSVCVCVPSVPRTTCR